MVKVYKRRGGLLQSQPLTPDEQRYDDTCLEIDQLEEEIGNMSASLFTARELTRFGWFTQKTFVFPRQEQLDRQLAELRALVHNLGTRSNGAAPEPPKGKE